MEFRVEVENVSPDPKKWIVARFDAHTRKLWYWGSWDSKPQAEEIAKMTDGLVIERVD